jgi:hypothetical protein
MIVPANETGKTDEVITIEQNEIGTSDWYAVPQGSRLTMVEAVPSAGGAVNVEHTIDPVAAKAGNVDGVPWTTGEVTERSQLMLNGSGFIRAVVSAGTAKVILRAVKA